LSYTEDGHSSEDVLVVNPLTGEEQKILGVPTLDNGAPASLEEAQADGDDHENCSSGFFFCCRKSGPEEEEAQERIKQQGRTTRSECGHGSPSYLSLWRQAIRMRG
jgi:hypothetical protein